jgi:hypothetical protein
MIWSFFFINTHTQCCDESILNATSEQLNALTNFINIHRSIFKMRAGEYDCVYLNMPRTLFGKVGEIHEAKGKLRTAAGRANLSTAKQDDGAEVYQIIDSIPKKTAE